MGAPPSPGVRPLLRAESRALMIFPLMVAAVLY